MKLAWLTPSTMVLIAREYDAPPTAHATQLRPARRAITPKQRAVVTENTQGIVCNIVLRLKNVLQYPMTPPE